jgi:hypothetical protein
VLRARVLLLDSVCCLLFLLLSRTVFDNLDRLLLIVAQAHKLRCSLLDPAENGIFAPFLYKNDHFAKTGSGQT